MYNKELARQIHEEYSRGISVKDISKITGKTEKEIEDFVKSDQYLELVENFQQFVDELALGNSDWYLEYRRQKNAEYEFPPDFEQDWYHDLLDEYSVTDYGAVLHEISKGSDVTLDMNNPVSKTIIEGLNEVEEITGKKLSFEDKVRLGKGTFKEIIDEYTVAKRLAKQTQEGV